MKLKLTHGTFLGLSLLLASCSYLGPSDPTRVGGLKINNDKVQSSPINFATAFTMVIQPKCLKCHETFASEERVKARKDSIESSVFVRKTMPKPGSPQLTACELEVLQAYLNSALTAPSVLTLKDLPACSSPEPEPTPEPNDTPEPTATPAPVTLDFSNVNALVLQPKCLRCHDGDKFLSSASGIRETTPELMFVVFTERSMPPKHLPPERQLDSCQLEILKAYLEDGAPETSSRRISDLPACTGT